jgi:hypothetical protein
MDLEEFLNLAAIFLIFEMKFSQRYIADMLGVACNSRLPQAKGSVKLIMGNEKGNRLPFATAPQVI